ncbi:hypothetical protein HBI06_249760 [Parastagonospora nodorum]|nr:hypothetical protein HBI06_249760 [Parastagonospora nodorum]
MPSTRRPLKYLAPRTRQSNKCQRRTLDRVTNILMHTSLTNLMHASLRKELEARHSLSNLSVHNLVEKFARHVSLQRNYSLRLSYLIRLQH